MAVDLASQGNRIPAARPARPSAKRRLTVVRRNTPVARSIRFVSRIREHQLCSAITLDPDSVTGQSAAMTRLMIRIDLDGHGSFGPGKARLLELIDELSSLRQAASAMDMSYRQAWLLIKATENTFGAPLIESSTGGARGGGSHLTTLGREVLTRYRALETVVNRAARSDVTELAKLAEPAGAVVPTRRKLRPRTKS